MIKKQILTRVATTFTENTTAHGLPKLSNKYKKSTRQFWSLTIFIAFLGITSMSYLRIEQFISGQQDARFVSNYKDSKSLEMFSLSACSDGYFNEFMTSDVIFDISEGLDNLKSDEMLNWILMDFDGFEKIEKLAAEGQFHFLKSIFESFRLELSKQLEKQKRNLQKELKLNLTTTSCIKIEILKLDLNNHLSDYNFNDNNLFERRPFLAHLIIIMRKFSVCFNTFLVKDGEVYINLVQNDENIKFYNYDTTDHRLDQSKQSNYRLPTCSHKKCKIFLKNLKNEIFDIKLRSIVANLTAYPGGKYSHYNEEADQDEENSDSVGGSSFSNNLKRFSKILEQESSYTQFYRPRNLKDLIFKRKITKILDEVKPKNQNKLGSYSTRFGNENPFRTNISDEFTRTTINPTTISSRDYVVYNFENIKINSFSDLLLEKSAFGLHKRLGLYRKSHLGGSSDSYASDDNQNNLSLTSAQIIQDIGINPIYNIKSSSLFNVKINNIFNSKFINISQHYNFDSSCFRIDFDQVKLKQDRPGLENGLKLELKIPKIFSDEEYKIPFSRVFPKRIFKYKERSELAGMSGRASGRHGSWIKQNEATEIPNFKSDFYIMVYPNNLVFPTRESTANTNIYPEKLTKIGVSLHEISYIHDRIDKTRLCNKTVKPLPECMKDNIKCQPFSVNSTCLRNVSEPIDPFNPEEIGCYPMGCQEKFYKIDTVNIKQLEHCQGKKTAKISDYFYDLYKNCQGDDMVDDVYREMNNFKKKVISSTLRSQKSESNFDTTNEDKSSLTNSNLIKLIAGKNFINPNDGYNPDIIYDTYHIQIGHQDLFINSIKEVQLDTFLEALIDVLGTTGFWMGFSFITFIEFMEFLAMFLRNYLISDAAIENKEWTVREESEHACGPNVHDK